MIEVRRTGAIEQDLKPLKKYPSVPVSLLRFENLLAQDSRDGHALYSGLGLVREDDTAKVYKVRVVCKELGGKRSGLRYVYERIVSPSGAHYCVCLAVYTHHSGIKESVVRSKVKERFMSYEASTLEALDDPLS